VADIAKAAKVRSVTALGAPEKKIIELAEDGGSVRSDARISIVKVAPSVAVETTEEAKLLPWKVISAWRLSSFASMETDN